MALKAPIIKVLVISCCFKYLCTDKNTAIAGVVKAIHQLCMDQALGQPTAITLHSHSPSGSMNIFGKMSCQTTHVYEYFGPIFCLAPRFIFLNYQGASMFLKSLCDFVCVQEGSYSSGLSSGVKGNCSVLTPALTVSPLWIWHSS